MQPVLDRRRLSARRVCERYGIVNRTLARWIRRADLRFPEAKIINGRRYWRLVDLDAWDSLPSLGGKGP